MGLKTITSSIKCCRNCLNPCRRLTDYENMTDVGLQMLTDAQRQQQMLAPSRSEVGVIEWNHVTSRSRWRLALRLRTDDSAASSAVTHVQTHFILSDVK